jgi:MFS family permease
VSLVRRPVALPRFVPASLVPSSISDFSPEVRRTVRIDLGAALLLTCFTSLTTPFTGLILRREFGATPFQLSLLAAAGAAFMLCSLMWAKALENRRPLPCVVWTGFIARGLFLLVPFVDSAWAFVAILVAVNFLGTVGAPAATALVERLYPSDVRGRALGVVRTAGALPGIVLVVGAGNLLGVIDYRWAFVVAAVIGMAGSLQLRRLPVPDGGEPIGGHQPRPSLGRAARAMREDGDLRRLMAAIFIFGTGIWIQMPAHPILMADVLQVTTAQAGMFSALAAIAGLAGNSVWGRLVDTRGSLRALRWVFVVGSLTPLVSFVATSSHVLAVSYVTESLMSTGLDLVMMLAIIEVAGRRRVAEYAAIAATLAGIRGVIAPLVGGLVIRYAGVRMVYAVAAIIMVGAVAFLSRQLERAALPAPGMARAIPAPALARVHIGGVRDRQRPRPSV